jgi:flagellar L-ring protein precursor FlgH
VNPLLPAAAGLLCLGACTAQDIGRAPTMSLVGSGISPAREPLPIQAFPAPHATGYHSLWNDGRADLFQDPRARNVGDVVTVLIFIDDRASLDNQSDRSRDSSAGLGASVGYSVDGFGTEESKSGDAGLEGSVTSSSSSAGSGSIDRSEEIELSIAAVVTEVLPNGNLLVSGSQEVRVNYELRVLNIAGIVRPRDISTNNTISYDKIAEARISYGGRGRISEVQQPAWGQQIYDRITPF